MAYTDMQRTTLGEAVTLARLDNGWGKEEAARQAGISSITWKRVEDGQSVQDVKLRAIEVALGWPPGAADRIADGDTTDGLVPSAEHRVQKLRAEMGRLNPLALRILEVAQDLAEVESDDLDPAVKTEASKHLLNAFQVLLDQITRSAGIDPEKVATQARSAITAAERMG